MKLTITAAILFAAVLSAQQPASPLIAASKAVYGVSKNDVMGSVDKIPDDLWSFQPTKEVRTVAQLFAHIANSQYKFCSAAAGKPVSRDVEKRFVRNICG